MYKLPKSKSEILPLGRRQDGFCSGWGALGIGAAGRVLEQRFGGSSAKNPSF
jgi:hypothetical protein